MYLVFCQCKYMKKIVFLCVCSMLWWYIENYHYKQQCINSLWWIEPGWMPDPLQAALSLCSSTGQGKENIMNNRERSLTNYHHQQNIPNLRKLIEFITNQIRVGQWETKPYIKKNTFHLPLSSSWAQLHSRFSLPPSHRDTGEQGMGAAFILPHVVCGTPASVAGLFTVFPCFSMEPFLRGTATTGMGSALASHRSVLELAGIGTIRCEEASSSFSQNPPCSPPLPKPYHSKLSQMKSFQSNENVNIYFEALSKFFTIL